MRRPESYVGKVTDRIKAPTKKRRGKPHKRWEDCIKADLSELGMTRAEAEAETVDRSSWRTITCMADPVINGNNV